MTERRLPGGMTQEQALALPIINPQWVTRFGDDETRWVADGTGNSWMLSQHPETKQWFRCR